MNKETREDKSAHQQMQAQNKRLADMNDAEFAAEFDRLTDEQAKKALQQLQQNLQDGNNKQA